MDHQNHNTESRKNKHLNFKERMSDYSSDDIAFIEDWFTALPRRILNSKAPEELFEIHLDQIYST